MLNVNENAMLMNVKSPLFDPYFQVHLAFPPVRYVLPVQAALMKEHGVKVLERQIMPEVHLKAAAPRVSWGHGPPWRSSASLDTGSSRMAAGRSRGHIPSCRKLRSRIECTWGRRGGGEGEREREWRTPTWDHRHWRFSACLWLLPNPHLDQSCWFEGFHLKLKQNNYVRTSPIH